MHKALTAKTKRIGIYCDLSAMNMLTYYRIRPTEVLAEAVRIFRMNDLHLPYDLESCSISLWLHNLSFAYDIPELESYDEFLDRCASVIKQEFSEESAQPDIAVFFTGRVELGCGVVPNQFVIPGFGTGPMLIGVAGPRKSFRQKIADWGIPDDLSPFRLRQLRAMARVVAHEQAHLYGVTEHIEDDSRTLMYRWKGVANSYFDKRSLTILQEKLDVFTPRT
ncbi:MAG: hypothetical protein KGI60_00575 [Patescibacteria group bacterium]|nr:hypothetical protein [Patescibacteria group bacterium]